MFQLRTGLRVGETCALVWKDVDLATGGMSVSKTVYWSRKKGQETEIADTTKSGKTRLLPSSTEDLVAALQEWRAISQRSAGLICSKDGFRPPSYRAIQARFNKAFKKLGMEFASTHVLRHSFATDFLEKTQNQYALKECLGHSKIEQTEVYAKVTEKLKKQGMDDYNRSLKKGAKVLKFEAGG